MIYYGDELKLFQRHLQAAREAGSEPELKLTPRGDPDPRLIQLARLLGRHTAKVFWDESNRSS